MTATSAKMAVRTRATKLPLKARYWLRFLRESPTHYGISVTWRGTADSRLSRASAFRGKRILDTPMRGQWGTSQGGRTELLRERGKVLGEAKREMLGVM